MIEWVSMFTKDFDYKLPEDLIANAPVSPRDASRLMVLDRDSKEIKHHNFFDLSEFLRSDDVLVFNESKVIPARILFEKNEILLLRDLGSNVWEAMVRPGRVFKEGSSLDIKPGLSVFVQEVNEDGTRILKFEGDLNLEEVGVAPFPPYIKDSPAKLEDYQTIYAKTKGSVAAPTAGLHFTDNVFEKLDEKGVQTEFLTLHVGMGTFQPVKADNIKDHKMHSEWFSLNKEVTSRLNLAKEKGGRIFAVGTTSVRVLESCTENGRLVPQSGDTDIFIYPGYEFKFVDGMVTNFHLPKSTLMMLVSAFADKDFIFGAYEEAVKEKYRFYSFGDSMLIL